MNEAPSANVYTTERDERTFISAGPFCPSPSFSTLAPYSLNSSHAQPFLGGRHVVDKFIEGNEKS